MELDILNTLKTKDRGYYKRFLASVGLPEGEEKEIKLLYNAFCEVPDIRIDVFGLARTRGNIKVHGYLVLTNKDMIFVKVHDGRMAGRRLQSLDFLAGASKMKRLRTLSLTHHVKISCRVGAPPREYEFAIPTHKSGLLKGHLVPKNIDEAVGEMNALIQKRREEVFFSSLTSP